MQIKIHNGIGLLLCIFHTGENIEISYNTLHSFTGGSDHIELFSAKDAAGVTHRSAGGVKKWAV